MKTKVRCPVCDGYTYISDIFVIDTDDFMEYSDQFSRETLDKYCIIACIKCDSTFCARTHRVFDYGISLGTQLKLVHAQGRFE